MRQQNAKEENVQEFGAFSGKHIIKRRTCGKTNFLLKMGQWPTSKCFRGSPVKKLWVKVKAYYRKVANLENRGLNDKIENLLKHIFAFQKGKYIFHRLSPVYTYGLKYKTTSL